MTSSAGLDIVTNCRIPPPGQLADPFPSGLLLSGSLYHNFMDILVIDCTYKTNKYRMPLFNAIIVTGMNTVLPLAQIWIPGEAEPDYTWALSKLRDLLVVNSIPMPRVILTDRELACTNATETVFPTSAKLLCQWHINRNVLAQAQKKIGQLDVQNSVVIGKKKKNSLATDIFMAKFYETVASETEEEFSTRSAGLRDLSSSMGKYLDKEWWPYKEKIVKCWTNRFSHFGTLSTSTVEGTHASTKRWLDNSRGDLLKVFMQLLPWWIGAARRVSFQTAKDTNAIPIIFRGDDRFSAVVQIISVWALTQTNKLWNKARKIVIHGLERSTCDGSFRRVHGRPCIHELMAIIDSDGRVKLTPDHFDKHWWLPEVSSERNERVLEPATLPKRGVSLRPRLHQTGHGEHSTRREPSRFEIDDQPFNALGAQERSSTRFQALLNDEEFELLSIQDLLLPDRDEEFQRIAIPPRSWAYAGLRSLDE